MGLLLIAAVVAAKKRQDELARAASRRREQERAKANKNRNYYGSYSGGYTSYSKPVYEYMYQEMKQENSGLIDFFKLLINEHNESLKKLQEQMEQKKQELEKEIKNAAPTLEKFNKLAINNGFEISISNYNDLTINNTYSFYTTDKNIIGTMERKIESLTSELKEKQEAINAQNNKVIETTKKAKYAIFKRKEKKAIRDSAKEVLNSKVEEYERNKEELEKFKRFVSFAKENKEMFNKALEESVRLNKLKVEKEKTKSTIYSCNRDIESEYINHQIMEKVFEKMLEEGKITRESLIKICTLISKKEEMIDKESKQSEEYPKLPYNVRGKLQSVAKWFYSNIFELGKYPKEETLETEQSKKLKV